MTTSKFIVLGAAIVVALTVAGCASIVTGTTQTISVSSNIDGASIFLDEELVGTTPFVGPVKKNGSTLRIEADGYRSETYSLSKSLEPMFWGNIIIGGTLGSITDFSTGAAYQYAPAAYQVDLQASDQSDASFHQNVGVRKFGMVYVDQLSMNIAAGGGEYVDALVTLSEAEGDDGLTFDEIAAALEASRGHQLAFGDLLVAAL
ncbi:MAG: PEGA domain-containing protein [Bacteroidota bacterium]